MPGLPSGLKARTCSPAGACSIVIASLQRKGQKSEVGKKTLRVSTPRNSSPTIFARFSRPRNSSHPEFESHDIARVSTSRNSSPTTFARFSTAVLEARAGPIQYYLWTTETDLERGARLKARAGPIQYYFCATEEVFKAQKSAPALHSITFVQQRIFSVTKNATRRRLARKHRC